MRGGGVAGREGKGEGLWGGERSGGDAEGREDRGRGGGEEGEEAAWRGGRRDGVRMTMEYISVKLSSSITNSP